MFLTLFLKSSTWFKSILLFENGPNTEFTFCDYFTGICGYILNAIADQLFILGKPYWLLIIQMHLPDSSSFKYYQKSTVLELGWISLVSEYFEWWRRRRLLPQRYYLVLSCLIGQSCRRYVQIQLFILFCNSISYWPWI